VLETTVQTRWRGCYKPRILETEKELILCLVRREKKETNGDGRETQKKPWNRNEHNASKGKPLDENFHLKSEKGRSMRGIAE